MHADGTATVMVNDAELGQGITTTFAMLVAEELDLPLDRMRFELASAEPRYYDPNQHGMATGGSRSTKSMGPFMRQAGATARAMLVAAAAQTWNVDAQSCTTAYGVVHGPGNRTAREYAELLRLAAALPVPATVALKTPDHFRLIGTRPRRLDVPPEDERPCGLRHRRQGSGHAVCVGREAARNRRPGCDVRRRRCDEGSRRAPGGANHVGRGGGRR